MMEVDDVDSKADQAQCDNLHHHLLGRPTEFAEHTGFASLPHK